MTGDHMTGARRIATGAIVDPRSPCLVGTARRTWRDAGATPEPLDMWTEVAQLAAADVGSGDGSAVLAAVDDLGLVHCQSWYYDDPPRRLADRLALPDARRGESILAGTSPQRLLNAAATRMWRGETDVALVVGGEALAARRTFDRDGTPPPWSHPHPDPPALPVRLDEWYLPTEIEHGILPAWLTFALLEQARWASRGAKPADRGRMARVVDRLNAVAASTDGAWFPERRSATELTTPSADNPLVTTPYTRRMTAFLDVDMAAANLMVTHEVADRWGVPPERRVYLRGWGFARDEVHLAQRAELAGSPAMRHAFGGALAMAGVGLGDVDLLDLYSCFPSAVQFAMDALGLADDDPRPPTVTGGLAYHGGPGSNYMSHSIGHVVDRIRSGDGDTALVSGVGMHMTKHVAAVWSRVPGGLAEPSISCATAGPASCSSPTVTVLDRAEGPAALRAATVVHHPADSAPHVVAICETAPGVRAYARSDDPDLVAAVAADDWADATMHVRSDRSDRSGRSGRSGNVLTP